MYNKLKIGRNKLGGTGIKWITKFFMPNLEKIYLRCYQFIQTHVGQGIKELNSW